MRYESAVRTNVTFYQGPLGSTITPPIVTIRFEGRDFEWHANLDGDESSRRYPTISTMARDGDDSVVVDREIQRLLSALSFATDQPMDAEPPGATGFAGQFDRAGFRVLGVMEVPLGVKAPTEVLVVDDDQLRLALAFQREALGSRSPFYRFLAHWNALDVLFDGDEAQIAAFLDGIPASLPGLFSSWDVGDIPTSLASYLRESSRNAVAHAIRDHGRPVLDPDDPTDRGRLMRDARLLGDLVHLRVHDAWPYPVQLLRAR